MSGGILVYARPLGLAARGGTGAQCAESLLSSADAPSRTSFFSCVAILRLTLVTCTRSWSPASYCLAASLSDFSTSSVDPVSESSYRSCELQSEAISERKQEKIKEKPVTQYTHHASTPSGRRGHGDNVASMAGAARR